MLRITGRGVSGIRIIRVTVVRASVSDHWLTSADTSGVATGVDGDGVTEEEWKLIRYG
jgi:hypothetical protein